LDDLKELKELFGFRFENCVSSQSTKELDISRHEASVQSGSIIVAGKEVRAVFIAHRDFSIAGESGVMIVDEREEL